jgi:uncharacterized protein
MMKSTFKHAHELPIIMEGEKIMPGEHAVIKLNVGKVPSGSMISMIAHVYRSKNPGPVVYLQGGIHGDEINGIQIVTNFLESGLLSNLNCGSIIAIPLVNVYGFNNLSRDLPDGKDVNRCFPGSTHGSLASRLAFIITNTILPYVDYAIDLHTGGGVRYNMAQVRYSGLDSISTEMSKIFKAPFSIEQKPIKNSFRKTAYDMGVHTIVYEGGEAIRINHSAINIGVDGIKRLLLNLSMITIPEIVASYTQVEITKTTWKRATQPGIFIWNKKSGERVVVGDILGTIEDPYGLTSHNIVCKENGYIIGHNNASVVNQGDPLFHIGYPAIK